MNKLAQVKNKLKKNRKGFTLVELIIVMVILAILAAFLIPTMMGYIREARNSNNLSVARGYYVAAQSVATDISSSQTVTVDLIKASTKWTTLVQGLPTVAATDIGGAAPTLPLTAGSKKLNIVLDGAVNGAIKEIYYFSGNADHDVVKMTFSTSGTSSTEFVANKAVAGG